MFHLSVSGQSETKDINELIEQNLIRTPSLINHESIAVNEAEIIFLFYCKQKSYQNFTISRFDSGNSQWQNGYRTENSIRFDYGLSLDTWLDTSLWMKESGYDVLNL